MINNFLSNCYTKLWVPIFGRILSIFIKLIEGKKPEEMSTYEIDYTNISGK